MSETAANFGNNGSSKRSNIATTAASLLLSSQTGGPILTNSILTNLNKPAQQHIIQNGASSNPFRNKTPNNNSVSEEPDEKQRQSDYLDLQDEQQQQQQLVDSNPNLMNGSKQNGKNNNNNNFLSLNANGANLKVIDANGDAEMQQTVKSSKINRPTANENTKKGNDQAATSKNHHNHHHNHHNHHNKNNHHNNNNNLNSTTNHTSETILLKELMQLSIKREKIEKSLAATGYQKSIDAINWLMKHSRDPILVDDSILSTRDYILVLCPVGRLANQIGTFLNQSKSKCGPNEAHYSNVLPYMKLSSFFKVKNFFPYFFLL